MKIENCNKQIVSNIGMEKKGQIKKGGVSWTWKVGGKMKATIKQVQLDCVKEGKRRCLANLVKKRIRKEELGHLFSKDSLKSEAN